MTIFDHPMKEVVIDTESTPPKVSVKLKVREVLKLNSLLKFQYLILNIMGSNKTVTIEEGTYLVNNIFMVYFALIHKF